MKYLPNTPKEYAFVGSAVARLGTLMSGVLVYEGVKWWAITTLLITWIGHEVAQYFKLQAGEKTGDPDVDSIPGGVE